MTEYPRKSKPTLIGVPQLTCSQQERQAMFASHAQAEDALDAQVRGLQRYDANWLTTPSGERTRTEDLMGDQRQLDPRLFGNDQRGLLYVPIDIPKPRIVKRPQKAPERDAEPPRSAIVFAAIIVLYAIAIGTVVLSAQ